MMSIKRMRGFGGARPEGGRSEIAGAVKGSVRRDAAVREEQARLLAILGDELAPRKPAPGDSGDGAEN